MTDDTHHQNNPPGQSNNDSPPNADLGEAKSESKPTSPDGVIDHLGFDIVTLVVGVQSATEVLKQVPHSPVRNQLSMLIAALGTVACQAFEDHCEINGLNPDEEFERQVDKGQKRALEQMSKPNIILSNGPDTPSLN